MALLAATSRSTRAGSWRAMCSTQAAFGPVPGIHGPEAPALAAASSSSSRPLQNAASSLIAQYLLGGEQVQVIKSRRELCAVQDPNSAEVTRPSRTWPRNLSASSWSCLPRLADGLQADPGPSASPARP